MSGFSFENHSSYCHLEFTEELLTMPWEQIEGATTRVLELIQKSGIDSVVVVAPTLTRLPDGLLASLLRIWKSLDSRTRNLIFVTESDAVKEALQISGLLEHWRVMPSRAAALAFLKLEDTGELDLVKPGEKPSKSLGTDIKQSVSMEPFPFEAHKRYNAIQCDPQLSKLSWADLEAAVSAAISNFELAAAPNLLLDLSRLTYINSGVVAGLVRLWKATQKRKGQFAVVSPHEDVTSVLKTSGLARVWTITDTREEAAYALGVSESALVEKARKNLAGLCLGPVFDRCRIGTDSNVPEARNVLGVNSQLAALLLGSAALTTGLIALIKGRTAYVESFRAWSGVAEHHGSLDAGLSRQPDQHFSITQRVRTKTRKGEANVKPASSKVVQILLLWPCPMNTEDASQGSSGSQLESRTPAPASRKEIRPGNSALAAELSELLSVVEPSSLVNVILQRGFPSIDRYPPGSCRRRDSHSFSY
jgi:anti-anti-sigma factor